MQSKKSSAPAKKSKKKDNRSPVVKRLDAIIRLLMFGLEERHNQEKISKNKLVHNLHSAGLNDTEIGNIIGYERKNVAAMRTNAKKARVKKSG